MDEVLNEFMPEINLLTNTTIITSDKPKKRRKLYSCDKCRTSKTRCVVTPGAAKCDRCESLKVDCALPGRGVAGESNDSSQGNNNNNLARDNKDSVVDAKLDQLHDKVDSILSLQRDTILFYQNLVGKLNNQIDFQQNIHSCSNGSNDLAQLSILNDSTNINQLATFNFESRTSSFLENSNPSHQLPIREDLSAPFNLIKKTKETLFESDNTEEIVDEFKVATDGFVNFFNDHRSLCLNLSREFLEVSHYYIIPGGISIIDRAYVLEHPFITCVFVLISMMRSKAFKNSDIQIQLHKILKKILSNINYNKPLHDHDIEAILYICIYDVGDFDKWILSSLTIMNFFKSIDIHAIHERVVINKSYSDHDLFHLRILNSSLSCHLQYAIGLGKPILFENLWGVFNLTIHFPMATIGDAIQVSQLELFKVLNNILNDNNKDFDNYQLIENNILEFDSLNNWNEKWDKILKKDVSKITSYSYYFVNILISTKLIKSNDGKNTESHYSFKLLKNFLESDSNLIKGLTSFQLNQIVYSCIILFRNLNDINLLQQKRETLDIILRTYFNLNKLGQEMNNATMAVAQVIKKLFELGIKDKDLELNDESNEGFIGTGSVRKQEMYLHRRDSQQQIRLSRKDLPSMSNTDEVIVEETDTTNLPDDSAIINENRFNNLPDFLQSLQEWNRYENSDDFVNVLMGDFVNN